MIYSPVIKTVSVVAAGLLGGSHALEPIKYPALPAGSTEGGWESIPIPEHFVLTRRELWPDTYPGVTVPILRNRTCDLYSEVKHVVINIHGKKRDAWQAAAIIYNAQVEAINQGLITGNVLTIAPMFPSEADKTAGAAIESDMVFGTLSWAEGFKNRGPDGAGDLSSFDVIDRLVSEYLDKDGSFPSVERVVVVGHSLGGQAVQRWSVIRKDQADETRLHQCVQNPGSWCWLRTTRPFPNKEEGCPTFDDYKFGLVEGTFPGYNLAEINDLGRKGIQDRYARRGIQMQAGLDDHGNGDTNCEAETQGSTHLQRATNFAKQMDNLFGNITYTNNTIDYIEGVSHNQTGMCLSPAGLHALFKVTKLKA